MDSLKAALDYAKRGWLVVPLHNAKQRACSCRKKTCNSPGKHPRTEHGLKDGSKDARQIEQWFARWPDANVGILTGQESGLMVLDVDGESGKKSLQALTAKNGPLPKTLRVLTGRAGDDGKRKGCHYYFRAPAQALHNSAGVMGKGLDIRAAGGYVVAPPSLHSSGLLYEWLAPEQELAELPAWMLAMLTEARPAPEAARVQGGMIAEGGRNAALASLAGTMRRRGMSAEAIEAALMRENAARCNPPLLDGEVREIARSVARYLPAAPVPVADKSAEPVATLPCREWPAPLSQAALYGLAADFVSMVLPHTEADPAALVFQFLAAMGSIIGRGPHVLIGSQKHFAILFLLLVGNSSKARKGTSWSEVLRVCELVDIRWTKTRIMGGLTSGEGLIHSVRDSVTEQVAIKEKGRVVEYQEQTTDAGEKDKRLLCMEGEFAQPLQCAARDGSTLSSVIRQCWDSSTLRVMAKGSGSRASCGEPHVSIIGHITSVELERLLTASDAANGFANRFLWVCSARSKCLAFGGRVDDEALSAFGGRAREVVEFAKTVDEMAWAPEAQLEWERVYPQLSKSASGMFGQVTARAEAQALRMALIVALLDKSAEIRLEHLRAALELWRYCSDSAAYIFGQALGDPTADAIVAELRARPDGISRTELHKHFDGNKKKAELDRAVALAQENGLVRVDKRETGGRPVEMLCLVSV